MADGVIFIRELVRGNLEDTSATSPPGPVVLDLPAPGVYPVAGFGVPPSSDLIIELWSGGGGGGGGTSANFAGGSGGGGGCYIAAKVNAADVPLLVNVLVPSGGGGGTAGNDGAPGASVSATGSGSRFISALGGGGGKQAGGIYGSAGTVSVGAAITVLAIRLGADGHANSAKHGGNGGKGGGATPGAGGVGGVSGDGTDGGSTCGGGGGAACGTGVTHDGGNGNPGKARVSWTV